MVEEFEEEEEEEEDAAATKARSSEGTGSSSSSMTTVAAAAAAAAAGTGGDDDGDGDDDDDDDDGDGDDETVTRRRRERDRKLWSARLLLQDTDEVQPYQASAFDASSLPAAATPTVVAATRAARTITAAERTLAEAAAGVKNSCLFTEYTPYGPQATWSALNGKLRGVASAVRGALLSAAEELAAPMPPSCVDALARAALQGAPDRGGADAPGAGKDNASALQVGDTAVPGYARDVVDKLRLPVSSFEVCEVHVCAVPPQVHSVLAASEHLDYADCRAFSFKYGGIVLTYGARATVALAAGVRDMTDMKIAAIKKSTAATTTTTTTPAAATEALAGANEGAPLGADGGASREAPGTAAAAAPDRRHVRAGAAAVAALVAAVRTRGGSTARDGPPLGLVMWVTEQSVVKAVAPSSVAECLKYWKRMAVQSAQSIVGAGPPEACTSSETPHTLRKGVVRLLTCGVFTLLATCTRLDKKQDVHEQLAVVLPSSRKHVLLDGVLTP